MTSEIPIDLANFIDQRLESVAQLEILILLKQNPDRHWSPADVAKVLCTAEGSCAQGLMHWQRHGLCGLISAEPRYHYQPANAQLDALVAGLLESYTDYRVSVISRIYAKPVDRVRTFAEAFRFRGEP